MEPGHANQEDQRQQDIKQRKKKWFHGPLQALEYPFGELFSVDLVTDTESDGKITTVYAERSENTETSPLRRGPWKKKKILNLTYCKINTVSHQDRYGSWKKILN